MSLFPILLSILAMNPAGYDFLDQVGAIKGQEPNIKTIGVIINSLDYVSIKPAVLQLPAQMNIQAYVAPIKDGVLGRPDLYARQAVLQLLENHSVDCVIVFSNRGKLLKDPMVLKSVARTLKEKGIPVFTTDSHAKKLGFSGQIVFKNDQWFLKKSGSQIQPIPN